MNLHFFSISSLSNNILVDRNITIRLSNTIFTSQRWRRVLQSYDVMPPLVIFNLLTWIQTSLWHYPGRHIVDRFTRTMSSIWKTWILILNRSILYTSWCLKRKRQRKRLTCLLYHNTVLPPAGGVDLKQKNWHEVRNLNIRKYLLLAVFQTCYLLDWLSFRLVFSYRQCELSMSIVNIWVERLTFYTRGAYR